MTTPANRQGRERGTPEESHGDTYDSERYIEDELVEHEESPTVYAYYDDSEDLGRWAADLVAVASRASGRKLEPYDILPIQYRILMLVYRGQANTATDMADLMPVDAAAISRHVNNLVEKGILRRQRVRTDRRTIRLSLSESGQTLVPQLAEQVEQNNDWLLSGIGKQERRVFFSVIDKILSNAEQMEHRPAIKSGGAP